MKLKNKIAALSTLLILQNLGAANAAGIDTEIAIIAAEQDKTGEKVETFDPDSLDADKNKPKTKDEIKAEEKRLEREREEARKKIKEERRKSRDELKGKTPLSKNPAPIQRQPEINDSPTVNPPTQEIQKPVQEVKPVQEIQKPVQEVKPVQEIQKPVQEVKPVQEIQKPVQEVKPVQEIQQPVQEVQPPQNGNLPNPVVNRASFNEIVQVVGFTPLYIPQKSSYAITSMFTIDNRVAEIRYSRKWESNVSLRVRTYKRAAGEELQDISGVHGVKWRVNVANGITTYIAKIEENKHVAAWAVGNYTFSAYVENLSFASFYALVSDELVDLSQHYFLGN